MEKGDAPGSSPPHNADDSNNSKEDKASLWEQTLKQPRLGLKLKIKDSLIKSIEQEINSTNNDEQNSDDPLPRHFKDPEKIRAAILPALYIQIGNWRRNSKDDGDLVGKFFFASQQIAWEILEGGSKAKIEIEWSDIAAIRATYGLKGKTGFIDIELNRSPKFHIEPYLHRRKHPNWNEVSDFTEGPASNCRFQRIAFRPGVLKNHYEMIIRRNKFLLDLNQKRFPTDSALHFHPGEGLFSKLPLMSSLSVATPYPQIPPRTRKTKNTASRNQSAAGINLELPPLPPQGIQGMDSTPSPKLKHISSNQNYERSASNGKRDVRQFDH